MSPLARFALTLTVLSAAALAGRAPLVFAEAGRPEPAAETEHPTATPLPSPTPPPTPTPKPTPYYPSTNPWANPPLPAKMPKAPIIYGTYNRGCAIGLKPIALSNKYWEVVNDARNRFYAHPDLWKVFERVAAWSVDQARFGKLIAGDFAQPAGGPMTDGHNSHQIGLDGDIRFKFFPADKTMSPRQKSGFAEVDVADYYITKSGGVAGLVARLTDRWRDDYGRLLEQFATEPKIERIFVSPAIKRRMCELYRVLIPPPTPTPTPTPVVAVVPAPAPALGPAPGASPGGVPGSPAPTARVTPSPTPAPAAPTPPPPPPTPTPVPRYSYPSWLLKLRPILGHTAHFHIRHSCPRGMRSCESQDEVGVESDDKSGVECEGSRFQYWFETDWKKPGFLREWVMENMPPPKPTPTPPPSPTPEHGKVAPTPTPAVPKPGPTPKKTKGSEVDGIVHFDDLQGHAILTPFTETRLSLLQPEGRETAEEIFAKKPTPSPTPVSTPVAPAPVTPAEPTPTPKPTPTPVPPRWKTVTHSLPKECQKLVHWGEPPPPLATPAPPVTTTPALTPVPPKPHADAPAE